MEQFFLDPCKTLNFDPADSPYGARNYNPNSIEAEHIEILNRKKIDLRRENEVYLESHPEIHGLISITLRHLLKKNPRNGVKVQKLCAKFFGRPREQIIAELLDYFLEINHKGPIVEELRREIIATATKEAENSLDPGHLL